ncbi:MAG TPA: bifunctional riboflavin kinase/FAD synthetase [Verrucomicrobiae bacterium]
MKVIHAAADLQNADSRPVSAAIGVFDGMHLGHQRVLEQVLFDAKKAGGMSVAVTFDRHPNATVAPEKTPPLIYPLFKKLEVLASLGLDAAWVIRFDKEFSQIPGEQFVRDLARDFGRMASVCVGPDFMFGYRRSGNVALLKELGSQLGFIAHAVPDVELKGQPVSSTRIRDFVRAGDFGAASQMLGRAYGLCGIVIEGEHLGRKLGFPTANLDTTGLVTPPNGVYVADAKVGGKRWRAAVNIGHRPTIHSKDPQLHVEAHLLDFDQKIVGRELELVFLKKLREEKKFPSLEALSRQIAEDVKQARDFF